MTNGQPYSKIVCTTAVGSGATKCPTKPRIALVYAISAPDLAFENYFYEIYRTYLLSELRHGDLGPVRAADRRLSRLRYADAEVQAALSEAAERYPIELA